MSRGLSQLQREILCAIWQAYQQAEPNDRKLSNGQGTVLEHWGVQWSGLHVNVKRRDQRWDGRGQSASERAADSRALRRLEHRGLVVRKNRVGDGHYTNYVCLTDDGKATAQRLTFRASIKTLTVTEGRQALESGVPVGGSVRSMVKLLAASGELSDELVIEGLRGLLEPSLVELILGQLKYTGEYQRIVDEVMQARQ